MEKSSQLSVESKVRRILRTPAAAEYLGLAPCTLEKRRLTGDGPRFVRLGGRAVGYDVGDLDAWLDQQRGESTVANSGPRDAA
ncbi:MAG: AlpA family phage regulatory protein [Acidobacteriia bacterium]|nr:AlpA family phage regulatory protein [Terriglobia bacterium]